MIDIIPKDYELPLYLFHNGTNCETYKFLGCHKGEKDGIEGYYFRVWAAHAEGISVVGDFNDWDEKCHSNGEDRRLRGVGGFCYRASDL